MPPEDKLSQRALGSAVKGDEWEGPWGSISPVRNSIETLCIQIDDEAGKPRIYYYPYRTIGKWNWNMAVPETLEIQVGGIQVTISGTGLRRLAEALNLGQLRLIQFSPTANVKSDIYIRSIYVD